MQEPYNGKRVANEEATTTGTVANISSAGFTFVSNIIYFLIDNFHNMLLITV
jgi:hypothetical protein